MYIKVVKYPQANDNTYYLIRFLWCIYSSESTNVAQYCKIIEQTLIRSLNKTEVLISPALKHFRNEL